jgi:hypothetical protein
LIPDPFRSKTLGAGVSPFEKTRRACPERKSKGSGTRQLREIALEARKIGRDHPDN